VNLMMKKVVNLQVVVMIVKKVTIVTRQGLGIKAVKEIARNNRKRKMKKQKKINRIIIMEVEGKTSITLKMLMIK